MSSEYDIEKYDREREERIKHLESLKEQAEEEFNSYHIEKRESFENRDNFEYDYTDTHSEDEPSAKKRLIVVASVVLLGVAGYFGYNALSGNSESGSGGNGVAVADKNRTSQKGDVRDQIESIVSTAMKKREESKSENGAVDISKMVAQKSEQEAKAKEDSGDSNIPLTQNSVKNIATEEGTKEESKREITKTKDREVKSAVESNKREQRVTHNSVKRAKKRPNFIVIRVKEGDTLASISERFYGNPMYYKRIIRANRGLRRGRHLKVGQRLIIPELDKKIRDRLYRIRKGDTLYKISKRFYGTTKKVQKIIDANYKIKDASSKLSVGDLIYIPR